ncbi:MAG: hypothetical protein LC777_01185 [Actinobacteria bacterium]|nr:hypothetical protein [Actinomycetota bacterium]
MRLRCTELRLTPLLAAAASRLITQVYRWLTDPTEDEAVPIYRRPMTGQGQHVVS